MLRFIVRMLPLLAAVALVACAKGKLDGEGVTDGSITADGLGFVDTRTVSDDANPGERGDLDLQEGGSDGPDGFVPVVDQGSRLTVITVTSPVGGESWKAGSSQTIKWTTSGPATRVNIALWRGSKRLLTIASNAANSGSYAWTVSKGAPGDSTYRVEVAAVGGGSDRSPANFTIINWKRRTPITLGANALSSNRVNYPVRLSLSTTNILYSDTLSGGADIRFSTKAKLSGTFDVSYWIERWTSGGTSIVWVKVPLVEAKKTQTIYLCARQSLGEEDE